MWVPIGLAVIAAGLMAATWRMQTRAPWTVLAITLIAALAWWIQDNSEHDTRVREREACISRVERSLGNRIMWEAVIGYLEQQDPAGDAVSFLRMSLDANLPVLSVDDCPKV